MAFDPTVLPPDLPVPADDGAARHLPGLRMPDIALASTAGGYHHHLGLNTWAGTGVPPAPDGTAGLRRFSVELPTRADLDQILARLRAAGIAMSEAADGGYQVSDPSANLVQLTTA